MSPFPRELRSWSNRTSSWHSTVWCTVHLEKRLVERDGVPYWVFLVEYAGAAMNAGNRSAGSSRGVSANLPDYRDRFKEPDELVLFIV